MSDANWGPQDASLPKAPVELPLFLSHGLCLPFMLIYLDLFIGCLNANMLLLVALLKQRFLCH